MKYQVVPNSENCLCFYLQVTLCQMALIQAAIETIKTKLEIMGERIILN